MEGTNFYPYSLVGIRASALLVRIKNSPKETKFAADAITERYSTTSLQQRALELKRFDLLVVKGHLASATRLLWTTKPI